MLRRRPIDILAMLALGGFIGAYVAMFVAMLAARILIGMVHGGYPLTGRYDSLLLQTGLIGAVAGACLGAWIAVRRGVPRHVPPGHCRECGYGLTGNVSGVCPECAMPISSLF